METESEFKNIQSELQNTRREILLNKERSAKQEVMNEAIENERIEDNEDTASAIPEA